MTLYSRYVFGKLLQGALVMLLMTTFTFVILYSIPNGPYDFCIGCKINPARPLPFDYYSKLVELHNRTFLEHFFVYFGNLLSGDLGPLLHH